MIIFSFDPGTCNLGYSICQYSKVSGFKLKFKKTIALKNQKEKVDYNLIQENFNSYFQNNKIIKYLIRFALKYRISVVVILENQYGINKNNRHAINLALQMIHMNFVSGLIVSYFSFLKEINPNLKLEFRFFAKRNKWISDTLLLNNKKNIDKKELIMKSNLLYLKRTKTNRKFIKEIEENFSKKKNAKDKEQHWNDACNMAISFVEREVY